LRPYDMRVHALGWLYAVPVRSPFGRGKHQVTENTCAEMMRRPSGRLPRWFLAANTALTATLTGSHLGVAAGLYDPDRAAGADCVGVSVTAVLPRWWHAHESPAAAVVPSEHVGIVWTERDWHVWVATDLSTHTKLGSESLSVH